MVNDYKDAGHKVCSRLLLLGLADSVLQVMGIVGKETLHFVDIVGRKKSLFVTFSSI